MRIRRRTAAVIGKNALQSTATTTWEGASVDMSRKSEDLPVSSCHHLPRLRAVGLEPVASHCSGRRVDLHRRSVAATECFTMPSRHPRTVRQNPQPKVDVDSVQTQCPVGAVASPCNGTCVLSATDETCLGCFRTGTEIADWLRASEQDRTLILERCARRRLEGADPLPKVRSV